MRILFITQKLKEQDAFGVLWVREFIRQGFDVTVACLEASGEPFEFPVRSMGKEASLRQGYGRQAGKFQAIFNFEKIILSEKYDRVFVHMSPVWYALGFWWWMLKGIPTYLWYTHYKMQIGVLLFGWFGKRFFCATPQSLPQYEGNAKKIVLGHGIDLRFWPKRRNQCMNPKRLLVVHRLSRSKRLEIPIRALTILDSGYTIDIYGIEAEPSYVAFLKSLTDDLKLNSRVTFHGTTPMDTLPGIYSRHRKPSIRRCWRR
jgi:glycosyltransferase involved in cell wall biosynthesis